jgi:hypothetical protein
LLLGADRDTETATTEEAGLLLGVGMRFMACVGGGLNAQSRPVSTCVPWLLTTLLPWMRTFWLAATLVVLPDKVVAKAVV